MWNIEELINKYLYQITLNSKLINPVLNLSHFEQLRPRFDNSSSVTSLLRLLHGVRLRALRYIEHRILVLLVLYI